MLAACNSAARASASGRVGRRAWRSGRIAGGGVAVIGASVGNWGLKGTERMLIWAQNVRTLRNYLASGRLAAGFRLCRAAEFPAPAQYCADATGAGGDPGKRWPAFPPDALGSDTRLDQGSPQDLADVQCSFGDGAG